MSISVPDLNTANAFVSGAYDRYTSCLTSYELVNTAASAVGGSAGAASTYAVQAVTSLPQQVLGGGTLLVGLVLMVYGYKLVRPVNFAAGSYLGWTASMILLTILAPTLTACPIIIAAGTASALLVGLLCAMHRTSVLAVLGIVAGEMLGDVFFKTFLASVAPEYVAFGCIGFFAVLLAALSAYAGDFAFQVFCAFFGSYLATSNFVKLVLVPYAPNGASYLPFLSFKPEFTQVLVSGQAVFASPYLYGPVLVVLGLTAAGTYAQAAMLAAAKKAEDMQSLIGK